MKISRHMTNRWLFAVMFLTILQPLSPSSAEVTNIIVREISRPPNYSTTTDPNDFTQLTDGVIIGFPMWTKRESVGWSQTSPIMLSLDIQRGNPPSKEPRKGTLRIHTAKGLYAGVDIPHRIDIYTMDTAGKYFKTGGDFLSTEQLSDKAHHWLTLPVSSATDRLLVVLHARGEFLFVDEMEWRDEGASIYPPHNRLVGSRTQALTDSIEGLQANLLSRALEQSGSNQPHLSSDVFVWAQDPWGTLPTDVPAKEHELLPKQFTIEGFQGEQESICLGLRTGVAGQASSVRITVTGISPESIRLFQVIPIVAANGQLVYDPLVPLDSEHKFPLQTDKSSYAWISFDLRSIAVGAHTFTLSVVSESGREMATTTGELTVRPAPAHIHKPTAVNWGYIRDLPIWRNPERAFQDLLAHGINVFVIHPGDIPGLAMDGTWSAEHATAFNRTISLARGKGTLLLYLGWEMSRNPLGISNQNPNLTHDARRRLKQWVERMSTYLEQNGFSKNQWAVYPVDEPRGENIAFLGTIAQAIKSEEPDVRLYADPTSGKSGRTTIDDLRTLNNLIDIWQPNLKFLKEQAYPFFHGLNKPWWLYGNPNAPAKVGSPLQHYRLLAWWSWIYGASGVGFWSYSDTNGSSAWSDLDGRSPDWAVVYESETQIVSSRRWEAFREGLEDYTLLSAVDRSIAETLFASPNGWDPSAIALNTWNTQNLYDVRHALLGHLR